MIAGLCSISLRHLSVNDVVKQAVLSGLQAIEWGGDIHVPHGNLETARDARQLCDDNNIRVVSYGSYWTAGSDNQESKSFVSVAKTAMALNAKFVRVWAGNVDGRRICHEQRHKIIESLSYATKTAADYGVAVSVEYHDNTLACTGLLTRHLMAETSLQGIRCHWQPQLGESSDVCLDGIRSLLNYIGVVHVFHWYPTASDRRPISEGAEVWLKYLSEIKANIDDIPALIEILPNDDPRLLPREARSLNAIIEAIPTTQRYMRRIHE